MTVSGIPNEPESARVTLCRYLEQMRLESFAAADDVGFPDGFLRDLDAAGLAFREKALRDRSEGEVRSALRFERRARALDLFRVHGLDADRLIRPVDFADGYDGKILMVRITGKRIPGRVCLRSGDDWHHEILKNAVEEMRDLGFETAVVTPVGGARVRFGENGAIVVYGSSDTYGACDKDEAVRLITRAFPGRAAVVRDGPGP